MQDQRGAILAASFPHMKAADQRAVMARFQEQEREREITAEDTPKSVLDAYRMQAMLDEHEARRRP